VTTRPDRPDSSESPLAPVLRGLHDVLCVACVCWRPLIAGQAPEEDAIAWNFLPIAGLCFCVLEVLIGSRRGWRWTLGWPGYALLALALLPAVLGSPVPAESWRYWTSLLGLLGAGFYFLQVFSGRERLVIGGLGAALLVHVFCAGMQRWYVLPRFAAELEQGTLIYGAGERMIAEMRERIANGGVYVNFTLANGLAVCVTCAAIPLLGGWWRWLRRGLPQADSNPASRRSGIVGPPAIVLLVLGVVVLTGAKGAPLALLTAGALLLLVRGRGPWRFAPVVVVILAVIAVLLLRPAGLAASAEVRAGYWHTALRMIADAPIAGHGLNAYEVDGRAYIPSGADRTNYAHSGLLEAAVSAGIMVAAWLAVLGSRWLWPRRAAVQEEHPARPVPPTLLLVPLLVLPYVIVMHSTLVSDNLAFWPPFAGPISLLYWALAIGACAAAGFWVGSRPAGVPALAADLAIGTFALACLIDFHLQDPTLIAVAVIVACLVPRGREPLRHKAWMPAIALAIVLAVAVQAFGLLRFAERRATSGLLEETERTRAADRDVRLATWHRLLGGREDVDLRRVADDPGLAARFRSELLGPVYVRARAWPPDRSLWMRIVTLDPDDRRVVAQIAAMEERGWESDLMLIEAHRRALARGDHRRAVDRFRRWVARFPASRHRQREWRRLLERILEREDLLKEDRQRYRELLDGSGNP